MRLQVLDVKPFPLGTQDPVSCLMVFRGNRTYNLTFKAPSDCLSFLAQSKARHCSTPSHQPRQCRPPARVRR